ncbi:fatty acid desaturase 6-like [Rhopilema esculentum]|uniref:fatty acid desaturase 6-like n=1 Tax=Rhopilema esculentum TaxID=499914 RepID=UPI0031CDFA44|eukprot:gene12440-3109_t
MAATGEMNENLVERKNTEKFKDTGDYGELCKIVKKVVKESSHWELYGRDQCIVATAFLLLLPMGFLLVRQQGVLFLLGLFLLGTTHMLAVSKAAHAASHNALCATRRWNDVFGVFFGEICGAFSFMAGRESHVNIHHPHTNVVGLGDSSLWKAPFLGRKVYLFIAPYFLPFVSPLFSMKMQWGKWRHVAVNFLLMAFGFVGHFACFKIISGLTTAWSLICLLVTRSMFYCPYIHVNIFQHIGLSMYHPEHRPKRLRLMATGVLNLSRNSFLDYCFGHSLINCHVEHHLFPTLSDNMCLKVKPIVRSYLEKNKLPYHEDSYWNRLKVFYHNYASLMVHAPPLTNFIGIQ